MASDGGFAATVFRWRFLVAVGMTFLILILGAATVRSDDPEREFSFMGRATIDGEPAPESTLIEIEVKGKVIGQGLVSGDDGKWVIKIDAALIQDGLCDAVFYVGGRRADRQWNRCAVDIRLEIDPVAAESPSDLDNPDELSDPDEPNDEKEPDAQPTGSTPNEPSDSTEPDDQEERDIPPTEPTSGQPNDSTPIVQPLSPSTGTGGLLTDERDGQWTAGAFIVVGWLVLTSIILLIVNRRAVRSRR